MLQQVWAEMDYRLEAWRVTNGGHIQYLRGMQKSIGEFLFPSIGRLMQPFPSIGRLMQPFPQFKRTDFINCLKE